MEVLESTEIMIVSSLQLFSLIIPEKQIKICRLARLTKFQKSLSETLDFNRTRTAMWKCNVYKRILHILVVITYFLDKTIRQLSDIVAG